MEYTTGKYNIEIAAKVNRKIIENITRKYLIDKGIIIIGKITRILQDKKCGFINVKNKNETVYFKIRDVKYGFAKENKYVEFEIIEYENKKRAINVKVINGGRLDGSIY